MKTEYNFKNLDWFIKDRLDKGMRVSEILSRCNDVYTIPKDVIKKRINMLNNRGW